MWRLQSNSNVNDKRQLWPPYLTTSSYWVNCNCIDSYNHGCCCSYWLRLRLSWLLQCSAVECSVNVGKMSNQYRFGSFWGLCASVSLLDETICGCGCGSLSSRLLRRKLTRQLTGSCGFNVMPKAVIFWDGMQKCRKSLAKNTWQTKNSSYYSPLPLHIVVLLHYAQTSLGEDVRGTHLWFFFPY